ncbi:hypothetical protein FP317_001200 [Enterococcus faecium]|nr:hypothetical protein [Enterococcus faecium]
MASSLYNLALDFSKELNYTKAIMARQGDKGITVTVKPFLNGLQMDTSGGTFTLKGTTPSNRYVDSVATSVTSEEVTFSLDGTFMSEAGYYKHCYVEYRKDNQILTTQDIIFFSLGVSDISQGQADEYVSQLEELIRKYNETFDAFMAEIKGRVDSLNKQITDLTGQAKTLQDKLDALKEEISKLGNLHVMYSNSIDFGDYDYSGNPNVMTKPYIAENITGGTTGLVVTPIDDGARIEKTRVDVSRPFELALGNLLNNTDYIISYDVLVENGYTGDLKSCNAALEGQFDGKPNYIAVFYMNSVTSTDVWQKVSVKFNSGANMEKLSGFKFRVFLSQSVQVALKIKNVKIERGSTATPYQPNLLDAPYYLSKVALGENIITSKSYDNSNYLIGSFDINKTINNGDKLTFTIQGTKPANKQFGMYIQTTTGAATEFQGHLTPVEGLTDVWSWSSGAKISKPIGSGAKVVIYQLPPESQVPNGKCTISWAKLEKGDTRTPNISEYKYRGTGMRDSNNPYDYVWDLAPEYVEDNLATDVKISEITGKANNYTDGKVSEINSQLTASIHAVDTTAKDAQTKANANATAIKNTNNRVDEIENKMPLYAIYGEGANLSKVSSGTKIPIGALIAMDFAHTSSDLPYTIGSDRNTLTATRDCVLFFEGSVKLHGDNTLKYAYVKIRKNGSDTNFTNLGSSVNFNYMTTQAGQYVHTLVTGDKVEFTIETAAGGIMFATQLLSLKISEVKPV